MLTKLLKLNANEAISSGATTIRSSGSVMRRKICQRAAAVDAGRLDSSPGIDWSAPSETRKKYGHGQPDADERSPRPSPRRVEEPRDVRSAGAVDDPEVVVQEAAPDEHREEAPGARRG